MNISRKLNPKLRAQAIGKAFARYRVCGTLCVPATIRRATARAAKAALPKPNRQPRRRNRLRQMSLPRRRKLLHEQRRRRPTMSHAAKGQHLPCKASFRPLLLFSVFARRFLLLRPLSRRSASRSSPRPRSRTPSSTMPSHEPMPIHCLACNPIEKQRALSWVVAWRHTMLSPSLPLSPPYLLWRVGPSGSKWVTEPAAQVYGLEQNCQETNYVRNRSQSSLIHRHQLHYLRN